MNAPLLDALLHDICSGTNDTYGPFTLLIDPATGQQPAGESSVLSEMWAGTSSEEEVALFTLSRYQDLTSELDCAIKCYYFLEYDFDRREARLSRPVRHSGPALDLKSMAKVIEQILAMPVPGGHKKRTLQ